MSARSHVASRLGPWVPLFIGASLLTCAGLVWLQQSSLLAVTGRRIYALEQRRQELQRERSLLLTRYAEATHPARLERRAIELGFGPTERVMYLPIDVPASSANSTTSRPRTGLLGRSRAAPSRRPTAELAVEPPTIALNALASEPAQSTSWWRKLFKGETVEAADGANGAAPPMESLR